MHPQVGSRSYWDKEVEPRGYREREAGRAGLGFQGGLVGGGGGNMVFGSAFGMWRRAARGLLGVAVGTWPHAGNPGDSQAGLSAKLSGPDHVGAH